MDGNGGKQMMVSFMFTVDENSNCSMSLHALKSWTNYHNHQAQINGE
jgi:hypothetical protein